MYHSSNICFTVGERGYGFKIRLGRLERTFEREIEREREGGGHTLCAQYPLDTHLRHAPVTTFLMRMYPVTLDLT